LYAADIKLTTFRTTTVFSGIYGLTSSSLYTLDITFTSGGNSSAVEISVSTSASEETQIAILKGSSQKLTLQVALAASSNNTISIVSPVTVAVESLDIIVPTGKYYPSTSFTISGGATVTNCTVDFCKPVGSKIGDISPDSDASLTIDSMDEISAAVDDIKYVEVDYINNEVSLASAWEDGTNTRNLTVSVNGGEPTRLEVPLSGVHSELFGPEKGWQDSATYGFLLSGWEDGENEIVVSNQGGELGVQALGADFVGLRVYN
jgi:alpha-galactosidase